LARQVLTIPDVPATLITQAVADTRYVNASGGDSMDGPLTVANNGIAVTGPSTFSAAPSAGGSVLVTQAAGDVRYLQPASPAMTDPVVRDTVQFGPKPSGTADTTLQRVVAGRLRLVGPNPAFSAGATGSPGRAYFGQAVPAATGTNARLDIGSNAWYDGTNWRLDDTTNPGAIIGMFPTPAQTSTMLGVWDVATDAAAPGNRLVLTRNGNLAVGAGTTSPANPNNANTVLRFGGTGLLEANNSATYVSIADNVYFSGASQSNTVVAGASSVLQQASGAITFSNAPSAGAGAVPAMVQRFQVGAAGGASFFPDGATAALDAYNVCRVRAGPSGLAGWWYTSADGVDRAFLGMDAGSTTSWRLFSNVGTAGNLIVWDLQGKSQTTNGSLLVNGQITTNTGLAGNGSVLNLSSTANIQLSPAASYVHPDGDNTRYLGHPSLHWASVYAYNFTCAGQMNVGGGSHTLIVCGSGGGYSIYNRSPGHIWFDANGTPNSIVGPEIDNKVLGGGASWRYKAVYAVNGAIQTCRAEEKDLLGAVEPADALDALLKTPISRYHPKDYRGAVDADLTFAGIVDTTADPRLQVGAGSQTSPSHQAALLIAAVQALSAEIDALKARLPA